MVGGRLFFVAEAPISPCDSKNDSRMIMASDQIQVYTYVDAGEWGDHTIGGGGVRGPGTGTYMRISQPWEYYSRPLGHHSKKVRTNEGTPNAAICRWV